MTNNALFKLRMPLNRSSHIYTIYSPHEHVKPVLHRIRLWISIYPSEYQPWWSWARFFPTRKCLCASTLNGNKHKLTAVTLTSQLRFSKYINSSSITPVSDFTSLLETAFVKAFLQTSHEIFLPCASYSSQTGESSSFGREAVPTSKLGRKHWKDSWRYNSWPAALQCRWITLQS